MRTIRDVLDAGGRISPAVGIAVYVALSELASDNQCERFLASHPDIARRAGVSVATVKKVLPILRQLGYVDICHNSTHGLRTRSTYILIRGSESTLATQKLSLAKTSIASPLAISEELHEESRGESHEGNSARIKGKKGRNLSGTLFPRNSTQAIQ